MVSTTVIHPYIYIYIPADIDGIVLISSALHFKIGNFFAYTYHILACTLSQTSLSGILGFRRVIANQYRVLQLL